jgi:membrane-associated phospholipid phosphatase
MTGESALVGVAAWVTHLGSLTLWSGVLALALAMGVSRAAIGQVAAALFVAASASHALKLAFDVPRPDAALAHIAMPLDASFPSGHTAQAAAVCWTWMIVTGDAGRRLVQGGLVIAAIGAVAWSRVALGVHRVEDVLAGAALGTLAAIGTAAAVRVRGSESV